MDAVIPQINQDEFQEFSFTSDAILDFCASVCYALSSGSVIERPSASGIVRPCDLFSRYKDKVQEVTEG
ncbi:protein kinase C eta type [Tachysurus ichikawai]